MAQVVKYLTLAQVIILWSWHQALCQVGGECWVSCGREPMTQSKEKAL